MNTGTRSRRRLGVRPRGRSAGTDDLSSQGRTSGGAVRLGVLDVGSNTVHLLVVDAHEGARPLPAHSDKSELRLAEHLTDDGLDRRRRPATGWSSAIAARAWRSPRTRASRTCSPSRPRRIREAANGRGRPGRGARRDRGRPEVLTGEDEARLTFLAVRRWFGWSSGRLLVMDIGGGSLEMAAGIDEVPDAIASLPLGAGRLTRDHAAAVTRRSTPTSRRCASTCVRRWPASCGRSRRAASRTTCVATSKTFKQLARLTGAPASRGPDGCRGCCR